MKEKNCLLGSESEEVHQNNWLKTILWQHGRAVFDRCLYFYARLAQLPRTMRRRIQLTAGTGLATLALALAFSAAPAAHAATITVDGTICTLAEAVDSANNDNAMGNGCLDGNGDDVIEINVATATAVGIDITSNIIINGNGNTIQSDGNDRLFAVNNGVTLVINQAALTNGDGGVTGGGAIFNSGNLEINRSTITGNQANGGGSGGAISNLSTLTINNSTISGNSATYGGGISNNAAAAIATINNATIVGNTAELGGGVEIFDGAVTLNRTIVTGNTAITLGDEIYNVYTINLDSYNLIGYGGANRSFNITTGASDVVPTEALNAILNTALANNGVQTHANTHALVAGSPALDVVPNGQSTNGIDQRGAVRDIDSDGGDGNTTDLGDIGAFEYQSTLTPSAVVMGRSAADATSDSGVTAVASLLLTAGTAWAVLRPRGEGRLFSGANGSKRG